MKGSCRCNRGPQPGDFRLIEGVLTLGGPGLIGRAHKRGVPGSEMQKPPRGSPAGCEEGQCHHVAERRAGAQRRASRDATPEPQPSSQRRSGRRLRHSPPRPERAARLSRGSRETGNVCGPKPPGLRAAANQSDEKNKCNKDRFRAGRLYLPPPAVRHDDPETRHRHDPESPRTKPEAEGSSWPRNATEPRGGPGPLRVLEHLPCCLQGDGGLPGGPRAPDPLLRHGDPAEATSCPRQSLAPHPGRRPRGSHLSVSSPFALSPVVSLSELRRPQAPREYSGLGHPQVFPGLSQCLD